MRRTLGDLSPAASYLAMSGGGAVCLAVLVNDRAAVLLLCSVALAFGILAAAMHVYQIYHEKRRIALHELIAAVVDSDAMPAFLTDVHTKVAYQNTAALTVFGGQGANSLTYALREHLAEPKTLLRRLQKSAQKHGSACEDVLTRRGHVRVGVHCVGEEDFLWRLEDLTGQPSMSHMNDSISMPMLVAASNGDVLSMNAAMKRLIGKDVQTLDHLFTDLPLKAGTVHEVSTRHGPLDRMVAEIDQGAGHREIYLVPVAGGQSLRDDSNCFDVLPVALLRLDGDGKIITSNLAGRTLLGDLSDQPNMADVFEGPGRPVRDWVHEAFTGRMENRPEVLRAVRGEQELYLQISLSRVVDAKGAGLVAILSDATKLKTLEAQFVQSQKMQAIGQLAGGVAHDFNNLLTAISGHCDLLMLRHAKGDPDFADLDQISQNANRAAALVGQLLAFSRKQTLKPQIVDLRDSLADLTHLLNRLVGEKIQLGLTHAPDLRRIKVDKRQLEQVVMNLVVNARDAMVNGGAIQIETENVEFSQDFKRERVSVPKGTYVSVKVIDEGTGIAADKLDKIFEPFFTTKRTGEGTGLGLSTAYGIIKQTGGYIFCDTVIGVGTSFTLLLPAYDDPVPEPVIPAHHSAAPAGGSQRLATVLLVEDEAPVRAFAARALTLRGYEVLEAENAEAALDTLQDPDLGIDVFVTDVIMPGMDGPTWVMEALKTRPDTAVVFMSGYAEEVFHDGAPPIKGSIFLPKPFSLSELTAAVEKQLN
ncbi:response regulator [Rhodobacteraceae bacterium]|nr:response regulator [Paracoccaceae bacterium]